MSRTEIHTSTFKKKMITKVHSCVHPKCPQKTKKKASHLPSSSGCVCPDEHQVAPSVFGTT